MILYFSAMYVFQDSSLPEQTQLKKMHFTLCYISCILDYDATKVLANVNQQ